MTFPKPSRHPLPLRENTPVRINCDPDTRLALPKPSWHPMPPRDYGTTADPRIHCNLDPLSTPPNQPIQHPDGPRHLTNPNPNPNPDTIFPTPHTLTHGESRAVARNLQRQAAANAAVEQALLGKFPPTTRYLPSDPLAFLPPPLIGPDDHQPTPPWLYEALTAILNAPPTIPSPSPFRFDTTPAAAQHNATLLSEASMDLSSLIQNNQHTTLGYGSEFRPLNLLEPLLGRHPLFPYWREYLTKGLSYCFSSELTESERITELDALLRRGNHQSATSQPDIVAHLLAKDVRHGFKITIPVSTVRHIPGAMVHPIGVVRQTTIDQHGTRTTKHRLTQDLTFTETRDGISINNRIDMSQYSEMVYGWCLPRILHYIVALRSRFPNHRILLCKFDYSDAYRRAAHSGTTALQTINVADNLAYISLRLTFGGSSSPPGWCAFSEVVTDLANELLHCAEWDHEHTFAPDYPSVPTPKLAPATTPFARAYPMAVSIPVHPSGRIDDFIDDLILAFIDEADNRQRSPKAVLLAAHLTSRPHAGAAEPLPRRPIFGPEKLAAEGTPAEAQTILGWRLDTRTLQLHLPLDKYSAWSEDLQRHLHMGTLTASDHETLVGRLNHAAHVLPLARHFLGRLRRFQPKRHGSKITPEIASDLRLWQQILHHANRGVSVNLLTTRNPTRICFSDACPFGIGGYLVTSGRAWRTSIPQPLYGDPRLNNLWEFTGMVINVWLECKFSTPTDMDCILALGDNTSAIGWLHNTSRLYCDEPAHKVHLFVARTLAATVLQANCCLASQHLKGSHNTVADLLSFRGSDIRNKPHPIAHDDPSDTELTNRFHLYFPTQIPQNFVISPLPDEINSWFTSVVQMTHLSTMPNRKQATKKSTGPSDDGMASVDPSKWTLTSSASHPMNQNSSSAPSSPAIDTMTGQSTVDLPSSVRNRWLETLSAKPQATWLRRSGTVSGRAPFTSHSLPSSSLQSAPS